MKILHIIDSGGLYGAEVMLLNLVAEQVKQGLTPIIASIGEKHIQEKPIEIEALKRGFNVEKFRMRNGPNYFGAMEIMKFIHSKGFNILHSHGYKGNILFGLLFKKSCQIPMVSTLHGWTSTDGFSKIRLYEWLDRKSLKYIDSVVLVTNAMKSHPKLKGLKDINFHVIPNGIPIEDHNTPAQIPPFSPLIPTPSPHPFIHSDFDQNIIDFCSKGFTIGSIGRLSKEKGYNYLIEAFATLIKKNVGARLIIIGEGGERNELEALIARYELLDHILMPGYRKNAEKYIPLFNAFVIPSLTEGLPITLLEAMQSSVPIIATEVGGMPSVLNNGEAGLLVKSRNPLEITEAIGKLYNNKKLSDKLSTVAYDRVIAHYSSKNMALEYLNIYKSLMQMQY